MVIDGSATTYSPATQSVTSVHSSAFELLEKLMPWVHGAQLRSETSVAAISTNSPETHSVRGRQVGVLISVEKSTSCVQESQILSSVIDGAKSTYSPGLQSET